MTGIPDKYVFGANIHSLLTTLGIISEEDVDISKFTTLCELYGKANGQTPLCTCARIMRIKWIKIGKDEPVEDKVYSRWY